VCTYADLLKYFGEITSREIIRSLIIVYLALKETSKLSASFALPSAKGEFLLFYILEVVSVVDFSYSNKC
ncbi:hypothetical protein, partial [Microcystis aeruginosa]|uniref:hypothetical protein n=1 Tax=Microcystis aeruginosa TaxID=1126 RepID=UPI001C406416